VTLQRYLARPSLRARTLLDRCNELDNARPDGRRAGRRLFQTAAECDGMLETRAHVHANDWRALYPELFERTED
jgi:hypothetical protein